MQSDKSIEVNDLAATLKFARFAIAGGTVANPHLKIDLGESPTRLPQSAATGQALVSNGSLGADLIRLAAGARFAPHTHAGGHLLLMLAGQGTLTIDGSVQPTSPGEIYLVPGRVPHAIGAITDQVFVAVGSPHVPIDSPERMELIDYEAILATSESLRCHICLLDAFFPVRLHDVKCPHCPCSECAAT